SWLIRSAMGGLLGWWVASVASAQTVPLEFRQERVPWNHRSPAGEPISNTPGTPPGSDGRMPLDNASGSTLLPTANQFRGLLGFGAVPGVLQRDQTAVRNSPILQDGSRPFDGVVAQEMKRPLARAGGTVLLILRRGQIGAPFLSRQVSFPFGSIVRPPMVDENGRPLAGVTPEEYWLPEPYTTNHHQNAGYYWSPHARQVFAVQPGPLNITWVKRQYTTSKPADYDAHPERYHRDDAGNYFRLYVVHYVVSGSPVKPPRKIYWTERGFQGLGKPVQVPTERVGAIQVVYHNSFPETVPEEYREPGDTYPGQGTGNTPLPELRTLWYDRSQHNIHAYNRQGRVFVELLGDPRPDGQSRVQLGFEIVDVIKQPTPADVTVELGDRIVPPPPGSLEELIPQPVFQSGPDFAFRHQAEGTDRPAYYAVRETQNLNDYLVHWMEEGEQGLLWPALLGRYHLVWPDDVTRYSHYLRPPAATDAEARQTAIALSTENVPVIEYQDPLDRPRAALTEDYRFYTWLDADHPAHRTLLRFSAGGEIAFERVFSWLDETLKSGDFTDSVATELDAWDPNQRRMNFPDSFHAPRVVTATVEVGRRITAPEGEPGATGEYLAGHINMAAGTLFDPTAYVDPLAEGFAAANQGAIIPVNAIPNQNHLEVWWFRPNDANAGLNAHNAEAGFHTIYWPAVLGRYTLQWPTNAPKIVLASNTGSGPLSSLEANGSIYRQPDPNQPGYNPNEEHALLAGGAAWATRDDLNLTSGENYSSEPFVLVRYTDGDGRPAMTAFQVVREDPANGLVFDYVVTAGRLLQPPMPLPLLGKPVVGTGDAAHSLNIEPFQAGGDLPGRWTASDTDGPYAHYARFTWEDRHHDFWVYRGLHAGLPPLEAGAYNTSTRSFDPLPPATAVAGKPFRYTVHASRRAEHLLLVPGTNRPPWLQVDGLSLTGTPSDTNVTTGTLTLPLEIQDPYNHEQVSLSLRLNVAAAGEVVAQGPLALSSHNPYTGSTVVFTNRPPWLAADPAPTNSFVMRFYYKTEPQFDWPGLQNPPPPGSIVPYLRPKDPTTGQFVGDGHTTKTVPLAIVHRPTWPVRDPADASKPLPTLAYGATLTMPKNGLPGVRDMLTANILYQQSIAADLAAAQPSVVLHDPTREKQSDLDAQGLTAVPGGVHKVAHQGRWYFPNLPPHLEQRVFYDPNRGKHGALVLRGEFVDDILGADYLLLNVLRGADLAAVKDLCPPADPGKSKWDALVDALATDVETFHESPTSPGTYEPDPALTVSVGVGDLVVVSHDNTAVDSYALSATGPGGGYVTLVENGGGAFTQPGDPVALHVFKVGGGLDPGEIKIILPENPLSEQLTLQHTADLAGRFDQFEYEWKIAAPVDGQPPAPDETMSNYQALTRGAGLPRYLLGGAGIRTLADNYVVMRYRPTDPTHPLYNQWSAWTDPALAEGWIKRVLAGINPFNQRIKDLFNNRISTDVSLVAQAGPRWEGDVALNLDTIEDHGLIEIYETVLRRGRALSIEAGYNYGPANDALLLAAGYLNDLYMILGNEALADALNPTIGIGTADRTYGEIATALFAFRGQVPSLLEEELALLRGRDDFLVPGVEVPPVYNRLVWNYTRGIDAGEVIYALNYNIQEDPNHEPDGVIDAEDAARMYPQGHGDAYGHYLTALKGYYSLLMNRHFDWVPRSEAVNVLGKPVSVDYQDERKFAAAAAALARAGRQVFDLTWRRDYEPVQVEGWSHLGATRVNHRRTHTSLAGEPGQPSVRYWGADHWACRTGQGAYLHWVVGNAILPAVDPNPDHEGIQKVDRTTVPELEALAREATELQIAMDNAEGGLTPLGIPEDGLVFDLDPVRVVGGQEGAHFEQIYSRAVRALANAVAAFDDAKDITRLMRSEGDSLADFRAQVDSQERAFANQLIEIYGTPYPEDIGPGKTWPQGYEGPDLIHYMYVDLPEQAFPELWSFTTGNDFRIDVQDLPKDWPLKMYEDMDWVTKATDGDGNDPREPTQYVVFHIGPHGYFDKPPSWTGRRKSPGRLQQAISEYIMAHTRLRQALNDAAGAKNDLDKAIRQFEDYVETRRRIRAHQEGMLIAEEILQQVKFANDVFQRVNDATTTDIKFASDFAAEALPGSMIIGVSSGGDLTSAARAAIEMAGYTTASVINWSSVVRNSLVAAYENAVVSARRWVEFSKIAPLEGGLDRKERVMALADQMSAMQGLLWTINERLRELDDAARKKQALLAEGERIQQQRLVFRQHAAAVIQGYRTRDAAFRFFRNEKLERYKTLFDLAARYALLAANAFDYETGLLGSDAGRRFKQRIINARALGVVREGQPQYAGSDTGDPGLSSVLAEMKADWEVLRGRLGFNNPDAYGTTVSLRTEAYRILPTSDGDANWQDLLQAARTRNLLEDADVRRYCLQIDAGDGLPVPGLVLSFSTTIADGMNLFGNSLAAGDHTFSPSSFATKIFAVGVAFEGYRGMDDPAPNSGAVGFAGGESPADPSFPFLDPKALSATPYVYLIPVGVDSLRVPPLGDTGAVRTWQVADLAIPLPFNIGASDFSSLPLWQSADFLSEPLFALRKHQAFRAVSDPAVFRADPYNAAGGLRPSAFTNSRLIGRSVWNSRWKLVIPGRTLLNDPEEGLDRFIQTVRDIKLHFVTYSYAGN
ncbi:MAG: hypothetical protein D6766_05145, partial [Verrucomicrobia bacterium]